MNEEDLRELYREYDRQSVEEAREIAQARKEAVGILKGQALYKILRKELGSGDIGKLAQRILGDEGKYKAASKKQALVLAYGRMGGEVSFSLADLCQFVVSLEKTQGKFNNDVQGVPYAALLRASLPVDKQRAQQVRNATFYQRRGNILYFNVTGNSKPFYRVQIRLEDWNNAIMAATPTLMAVQNVLRGRISFECPCGRHQYWYRYMASIGNYGLKPVETGFPKIRNRSLRGCCCKHVLKVLGELKSNRILLILSKELERERNRKGFSNTPGVRLLGNEDLRLAQAQRMSRDAMVAFRKYQAEAEAMKKQMKPRKARVKVAPATLSSLKAVLQVARVMKQEDQMIEGFCQTYKLKRSYVDAIIKDHNL